MRRMTGTLVLGAALAAACVTINVYFPEAAVKELAEEIEAEVRRAAQEGGEASPEGPPPSAAHAVPGGPAAALLGLALGAAPLYAAEGEVPSPEVTNPAIRRIIESRARRVADLDRYKAMGVVGEGNRALVEIRDLGAVADLRQRAEIQRLVKDENSDRDQLFREIAAATGVDLSQLPRIQETYAETLRQHARRGDWIQLPDGTWTRKE